MDLAVRQAASDVAPWDENADTRAEELARNDDPSYRALINLAISNLTRLVPDGGRVLDAGCGLGFLSVAIAQQGYDLTAVDPSRRSIELAQQLHEQLASRFHVDTIASFAERNPQPFDAVVANMTIHNVEKFQTFFWSAHTVLKDNGILYVATPNPRTYLQSRPDLQDLVRTLNLGQKQILTVPFRIRNHAPHPADVQFFHHPIKDYLSTARSVGFELIDFEQPLHVGPGRPGDISVMVFQRIAENVDRRR